MTIFEDAFHSVIGEEGGLSLNPADPGNWTGGASGKGVCRGTKYGIAASAHHTLDISTLTLAQAQAIYRAEYWNSLQADSLPPAAALLAFDAAVNCGLRRAICWLQTAAGCVADGTLGPHTMATIAAAPLDALLIEFQAQRLAFMAGLPTWHLFALGWARRLSRLSYQSAKFGDV